VDIPPLRERGDDILRLAKHYIEIANQKRRGKPLRGIAPDVERIFKSYDWSGNVRELRNVIERASILEDGDMVSAYHLPADMVPSLATSRDVPHSAIVLPPEGIPLESVEVELARQALERTGGNLTQAAKLLDISRDQLRYKLKKSPSAPEELEAN
jgi:DNA-binding NtrC family response regulator